MNELTVAEIDTGMVAQVTVIFNGVEADDIAALKIINAFNLGAVGIALRLCGAGKGDTHLLVSVEYQTGAVKCVGACIRVYIGLSKLCKCGFHDDSRLDLPTVEGLLLAEPPSEPSGEVEAPVYSFASEEKMLLSVLESALPVALMPIAF